VRGQQIHHEYVQGGQVRLPQVLVHPEYGRFVISNHAATWEPIRHGALRAAESTDEVATRHRIADRLGRVQHYGVAGGGMSCVPFARRDSGIDLVGDAWRWWNLAAGIYARGRVPELGSVLAFKSNTHMRLGHVAVVSRIINRREIEIDQANWRRKGMRGSVSRDVPVVDVSEANDWTAVRVGLGDDNKYGAVYPTHGFIYDRPDTGVIAANVTAPAPQPKLNPAPGDLRSAVERPWKTYEEVAEAPEAPRSQKPATQAVDLRQSIGATTQR
jgi:surface antigen